MYLIPNTYKVLIFAQTCKTNNVGILIIQRFFLISDTLHQPVIYDSCNKSVKCNKMICLSTFITRQSIFKLQKLRVMQT